MRGQLWNVALMVAAVWSMGTDQVRGQEVLPGNESETAEENPEEEQKEKPLGWLRVLAVGDAPPFRQEGEGWSKDSVASGARGVASTEDRGSHRRPEDGSETHAVGGGLEPPGSQGGLCQPAGGSGRWGCPSRG